MTQEMDSVHKGGSMCPGFTPVLRAPGKKVEHILKAKTLA